MPTLIIVYAVFGLTFESDRRSAENSISQPTTSSQHDRDHGRNRDAWQGATHTTGTLTFDIGPTSFVPSRNDHSHHHDTTAAAGIGNEPRVVGPSRIRQEGMSPTALEEGLGVPACA